MTIDVRLEGDRVIVLADGASAAGADRVVAETADLEVNLPSRRSKTSSTMRRAVVHDWGDRLTLNWGGDYPGGVRIEGVGTRVLGKLIVEVKPPVAVPVLGGQGEALKDEFDLVAMIVAMAKQLALLQGRIESLEAQAKK